MPRTILCKSCGATLNLPDKVVAGKRLRCPKCALRFVVTVSDASSESTLAAPLDADPVLTGYDFEKPRTPPDDLPLPGAARDLRDTFDLPLMSARDAERGAAAPRLSDAESLFNERPSPRRRLTAADARARARRCSSCGGLVPQGMSICASCGLDQESGMRTGFEDDLAPPPPPPPPGPPVHVAIVGGMLGVGSLIALILALANSVKGSEGWQGYGWLGLAIVSGFGIFACIQFIRLKSAKLLLAALTMAVVVDLLSLVAAPLFTAYTTADREQVNAPEIDQNPEDPGFRIKGVEDMLDTRSMTLGLGFLVIYAFLSVYLMSPAVKKPLHRANLSADNW